MSNYYGYALNPNTRKVEKAEFLDNFYGNHQYAVRFGDGGTYKETEVLEVELPGKTKSTNPLLLNELTPNYSGKLDLPKIPKKTPQEIKQRVEELKAITKRGRELEEEYAMSQKAAELIPSLVQLYEEYQDSIRGECEHVSNGQMLMTHPIQVTCVKCRKTLDYADFYGHLPSFEGFMQWLSERER